MFGASLVAIMVMVCGRHGIGRFYNTKQKQHAKGAQQQKVTEVEASSVMMPNRPVVIWISCSRRSNLQQNCINHQRSSRSILTPDSPTFATEVYKQYEVDDISWAKTQH